VIVKLTSGRKINVKVARKGSVIEEKSTNIYLIQQIHVSEIQIRSFRMQRLCYLQGGIKTGDSTVHFYYTTADVNPWT
jgi:hypothetical protein